MNGFYNPYSKYPDFAGGVSDIMNQIMMMLMMKNMMGPQTTERTSTTPQPLSGPNISQGGQQQLGNMMPPQMNPAMLMNIMKMLQRGGM